jgi:hypothetical protein
MTARNAAARPVVEWARRLGCEVTRSRSGHWRVTYHGRFAGTICATPSDRRSQLNDRSFIRRRIRAINAAVLPAIAGESDA